MKLRMIAIETEELNVLIAEQPLRRARQRLQCLKALERSVCYHGDQMEVCYKDLADEIYQEVMTDSLRGIYEVVLANDSLESPIPIGVALSLTVITHELMLNSITHAFEDSEGVQCVIVRLAETPDMSGWNLEISDTGRGLPVDLDPL